MDSVNRVQLVGNIGGHPDIRVFESGVKKASFTIATKREFTSKMGQRSTGTDWHFVIAWGRIAERIEKEMKKGSMVSVDGKIVTRSYTDKNGSKKWVTEVVAKDVMMEAHQ